MTRTRFGSRPAQPICHSSRHRGDGQPPTVSAGRLICAECREQVEEDLVQLPGLYELCAHMLDLRRPGLPERVNGHRPQGIALNDAVVAVRSEILGVLASWCGLVTNERGVTGPDELSIRRLTSFLAIHVNWLSVHPAAPDLVDELAELTRVTKGVLRPSAEFVPDVGRCPQPGCGQVLRAEEHVNGERSYRISCDAGHAWAADQWLLLWDQQHNHRSPEGAE